MNEMNTDVFNVSLEMKRYVRCEILNDPYQT